MKELFGVKVLLLGGSSDFNKMTKVVKFNLFDAEDATDLFVVFLNWLVLRKEAFLQINEKVDKKHKSEFLQFFSFLRFNCKKMALFYLHIY